MNRKSQEEINRIKSSILKRLSNLESSLKKFRSSSPDKWLADIGEKRVSGSKELENWDNVSLLEDSPSTHVSRSSTEDSRKTIAENEDFIKQKIGSIEDELKLFSSKIVPAGIDNLLKDIDNLENGLDGLKVAFQLFEIEKKNTQTIRDGVNAFQNGLKEIENDVEIILSEFEDYLDKIKTSLDNCLSVLQELISSTSNYDFKFKDIQSNFEFIQNEFNSIRFILESTRNKEKTIESVQESLEKDKKEVSNQLREIFKLPNNNQKNESENEMFDALVDLDEEGLGSLDPVLGYDIIDNIVRREEYEIEKIRDEFQQNLF